MGKPYTFYLTDLPAQMESLLDDKEAVVDPIRRFMGGTQREIYADARHYLVVQDANFSYAAGDEAVQLQAILDDPAVYRGNRMQGAKTLLDSIRAQVRAAVAAEKAIRPRPRSKNAGSASRAWPSSPISRLRSKANCVEPFDQLKSSLASQTLIAVIRDKVRHFDEHGYQAAQRRDGRLVGRRPPPAVYPAHPAGGNGDIAENQGQRRRSNTFLRSSCTSPSTSSRSPTSRMWTATWLRLGLLCWPRSRPVNTYKLADIAYKNERYVLLTSWAINSML